jgi:hypothetical protein
LRKAFAGRKWEISGDICLKILFFILPVPENDVYGHIQVVTGYLLLRNTGCIDGIIADVTTNFIVRITVGLRKPGWLMIFCLSLSESLGLN